MRYGLIGEKLGHSFSKEIHERLSRYSYELMEIAPGELDAFLKARAFDGINVTIPYKQAVIPYLDAVSDRAERIGAVNTIVNRNGRLYGDNTDFGGLLALLARMDVSLRGKTVLIAGTGGTSKTAEAVAKEMGAARVIRLGRGKREGALTYEEAYEAHGNAEILINTTPAGMFPDMDGIPVMPGKLSGLQAVADVVYNPLTTRLVQEARDRGIPAENGLYMLIAQALLAAELFTGESFGTARIEELYRTLLFEKRSIFLTGMPGSGKTTLGELLAKRLGRPLTDTDAEIVRRTGKPVAEIFKTRGEAVFRELETEVIRAASLTGGGVIATGGGAVLRKKNVDYMKHNGTVVFLDRPLSGLTPTGDRPLSDNTEKLRTLYQERLPVYEHAADLRIAVMGSPGETADKIVEALR